MPEGGRPHRKGSTMPRLLVMRHAKSSWSDATLADHDRPLNARGKRDAIRAGEVLAERNAVPDVILTSTAKRARKTAERVVRGLDRSVEIVAVRELYHADPATYASWTAGVPASVETVLVIGHNPGIAYWLDRLTGDVEAFPTAAIGCVTLDIPGWELLTADTTGRLEWFWYPKSESQEGMAT